MNILITLPKSLVKAIMSGEKTFEMRKCHPRKMQMGVDGFYVVEKGTHNVKCWCRVNFVNTYIMSEFNAEIYKVCLCVSKEYILNYAGIGERIYMWHIADVFTLHNVTINDLGIHNNPQQFIYCQEPQELPW